MTQGASGTWVLVLRGRRINLLLALRKSKRLLLDTDLKDKVVSTRAQAKVNHSRVGDTSRLLASQGRERVSIVTSLDTLDVIALRGRDPIVMGHHSPNHRGTFTDAICSSLPQHGPGEPVSVPGCYASTYYFVDMPHGLGHGSGLGSRLGLLGRDFRDLGACLHRDTAR